MSLPFHLSSAGLVREELCSWMASYGSDAECVDDARLVATELVGNAVRHASPIDPGVMLVHWRADHGQLALSVSDGGGPTIPQQRSAPPDAADGRGLNIVDALAQRWWIERDTARHTVHALLPLGALAPTS